MLVPATCENCNQATKIDIDLFKGRTVDCARCGKPVPPPEKFEIGAGVVVGNKYCLDDRIGESLLGEIYHGHDVTNRAEVRVNIMYDKGDADEEAATRFMQEIEVLSSLQHNHLLSATESGKDHNMFFFVTPHVVGTTLQDYVAKGRRLDEVTAATYLLAVADALRYIWTEKRLIHRDVKPQHILIRAGNEAILTGFDIAKFSGENSSNALTGLGYTIGTPEYMSPEQVQASADIDFRSDMYSLGVVMYELTTGINPFADPAQVVVLQQQMEKIPQPIGSVVQGFSVEFSNLVGSMLEKDRNDRFQNWNQLIVTTKDVLNRATRRSGASTEGNIVIPKWGAIAAAAGLLLSLSLNVVLAFLLARAL